MWCPGRCGRGLPHSEHADLTRPRHQAAGILRRPRRPGLRRPARRREPAGEADSDASLAAVRVLDGAEAAMLDTATSAVFSLSRFHRSMLRRLRPHLHETTREARGLAWSAIGLARSAEHTGNSDRVEPEIEQDLVAELRRAADATVSAIEHGGVAATTMGKRTKDVRVENTVPATELADASPVRQARRLIASVQRMRAAIAGPVRASRADEQLAGE